MRPPAASRSPPSRNPSPPHPERIRRRHPCLQEHRLSLYPTRASSFPFHQLRRHPWEWISRPALAASVGKIFLCWRPWPMLPPSFKLRAQQEEQIGVIYVG